MTSVEARAAMECLNRYFLENDTNDKDMKLHFQYKSVVQSKTEPKLRQGTIDRFLK